MVSESVMRILDRAGWYPERNVPIAKWVETLRTHGVSIVFLAEQILHSFGGLEIKPEKAAADHYSPGVVFFDPTAAAEPDVIAYWQDFLGTSVTPIGEVSGQTCLLLTEDGRVFGSWDRFLYQYGDSFQDALENTLLSGKRRPVEFGQMC